VAQSKSFYTEMNEPKDIDRFRKLLVCSGLFNIILAVPLIIPGFYKSYINFICHLNDAVGLGGLTPVLPEDGLSQLLINTAGIDLVLIGSFVLVSSADPVKFRMIPLLNAIGGTLFASVVVYYVVVYGILRFVLIIGVVDVLISCGFVYYLLKTREKPM
jgi:hypothetical protein